MITFKKRKRFSVLSNVRIKALLISYLKNMKININNEIWIVDPNSIKIE